MIKAGSGDGARLIEANIRQKWGIPDWRDERAYRGYARLKTNDFRWQFLRRTPAYRRGWETYGAAGSPAAFSPDAEENYGLEVLINPAQSTTPAFVVFDLVVPPWAVEGVLTGEAATFVARAVELGVLLTAIDPGITLKANIARITKNYHEYEEEFSGRIQFTKVNGGVYPEYFRILDARAVGVKFKAIADCFNDSNSPKRRRRPFVTVESLQTRYKRAVKAAAKLTGVNWKPTAKPPA